MDIIFEQLKETGIIKLNRPKALNALNYDMSEKFSYQLDEWEKNEDIKRVLLVGVQKSILVVIRIEVVQLFLKAHH